MSVELRPLNVLCNIQCHYCYQKPQRDADNVPRAYDMQKMKDAIEAEGGPFTLFGGEPLLLPVDDLEDLWSWGYSRFGANTVQTNGLLINDRHIEMFKKYKVSVGISLDGPGELNDARWHGDLNRTRQSSAQVEEIIYKLCGEGIVPSVIITLHRVNACPQRLPTLISWVSNIVKIGVRAIRLHLLESENATIRSDYGLTTDENLGALLSFLELERQIPEVRFDVFSEMRRLLLGDDRFTTCVWYACDPYTTSAVRGVEGQGQRSNCGRTNKDGIDFVKADKQNFERYLALYHTPQSSAGCDECRFFLMCKGQCPGTAVDGDWRNRTEHCDIWKSLYEVLENESVRNGQSPLSLRRDRKAIEAVALERWTQGHKVSLAQILALPQFALDAD